jgi:hypothetical protein
MVVDTALDRSLVLGYGAASGLGLAAACGFTRSVDGTS